VNNPRVRHACLLACALAAACGGPARAPVGNRTVVGATSDDDAYRKRLVAELQDEVIASYERDDPPDVETQLIPQQVGPARIGAGPGDVLFGDDVQNRASSRWPLFVQPGTIATTVRSKRLDIHLSQDKQASAAWIADELSWRINVCGHWAAIPLRITALYAHAGDRWVQVFEHLSFARIPAPYFYADSSGQLQSQLRGSHMVRPGEKPIVDRKLADELSDRLADLMSRKTARIERVVSLDPKRLADEDPSQPAPTLLLAPDPDGEWHGTDDLARVQIVDGNLRHEDRRVGTVGPDLTRSTVAYWVGNFIADLPARPGIPQGQALLRGTFVFEKRNGRWIVVQGHMSQPIDDIDLGKLVFGTSMLAENPLQFDCSATR
jgi:hypothetical protein